ncbi:hypothetical protein ACMDCR_20100 [Labrys okinawensis]|uniref:hypothetical protein n=1 Tax=Labrys okinawensis TaxID=346911 RepID=UPI0039BD2FD3
MLDLTDLHRAYMSSIRRHQQLLAKLHETLSQLGVAVESSPLDPQERDALLAGIGDQIHLARGIIASIDGALTFSALTRPAISN